MKNKIKEKTKKRRGDRINIVNKFKVNSDLAKEIIERDEEKKTALTDDRFSNMFQDEDFEIDRTSKAYMLRHGDAAQRAKLRDQDNEDDEDDKIMKQQLWDNAFAAVEDVMDEMSGRRGNKVLSSEDEDEEDERDGDNVDVALRHKKTKKKKKKRKFKCTKQGRVWMWIVFEVLSRMVIRNVSEVRSSSSIFRWDDVQNVRELQKGMRNFEVRMLVPSQTLNFTKAPETCSFPIMVVMEG